MSGESFLEAAATVAGSPPGPLLMPWPTSDGPCTFLSFETFPEWQNFIDQFALRDGIPAIVRAKFDRASKLYVLGWFDIALIKAGELIGLTALELALRNRYGDKSLRALLEHMVQRDNLTDSALPLSGKSPGSIIANLYETREARQHRTEAGKRTGMKIMPPTTIDGIRNSLAHGDAFDGLPWAGLLELLRDLIEYAYRTMIADAEAVSGGFADAGDNPSYEEQASAVKRKCR